VSEKKGKTVGELLKNTHQNSEETRMRLEESVIDAKSQSKLSLIIALLALSTSCLSAFFSYMDSKTDAKWQMQQIEVINKVILSSEQNKTEIAEVLLDGNLSKVEQTKVLNEMLNSLRGLENNFKLKASQLPKHAVAKGAHLLP